jgi:hypothetical protein
MATKQELLKTFEGILDLIEKTSGSAGLNEFENSNLPEFITWYEKNIQYCSSRNQILGGALVKKLKESLGGSYYERRVTQEYLKEYAVNCTPINPSEESSSLIFAGAMRYASFVFGNHLVLGGAYKETRDYQEILEHLRAICKILGC